MNSSFTGVQKQNKLEFSAICVQETSENADTSCFNL